MHTPRTQLRTYLIYAGVALACALVLSTLSVPYPHPSQAAALQWQSIVPVLALGCLGVWLLARTHLPNASGLWQRVGVPLLLGGGFGLVAVALDLQLGLSRTIATNMGVQDIHLPAPYSLLAYTAGGIAVESVFRLLPIGIATFLIVKFLTRGRWLPQVFIGAALLACLLEPLTQIGVLAGDPVAMVTVAALIYAFGLTASWQLWRHGVAAPLVMRLAFYAVWHVSLGPLLGGS